MRKVYLPHQFKPRDYQNPLIKSVFHDKNRHAFYYCHRRAGKDATCFNILVGRGCERVGTHLYLLPQLNQARRVIWRGINAEGKRFIDHIPKELIKGKPNSIDMSVELINGSILQLGGSNNYDAHMGTNPVTIIYSEFSLHHPNVRMYLSPILAENKGIEILQGTPRGKNHAWDVRQAIMHDKDWYFNELTVDDTKREDGTPVITQDEIDFFRRSGMSEEMIRQEFYCDWNVGVQGAYYTDEMDKMEREGRICTFEINKHAPVFTVWDIGVNDPTAIIFVQQNGVFLDIIDYLEKTDKGVDYFAKILEEKAQGYGIKYRHHFGPHDIMKREWGSSARSAMSLASDHGIHFLRVPDVGFDNGMQAARALFPIVRIHKRCQPLVDSLREYRREWDEENRVFKKAAFHNWASHGADAFRYLAVIWRKEFTRPDLNMPRKFVNAF